MDSREQLLHVAAVVVIEIMGEIRATMSRKPMPSTLSLSPPRSVKWIMIAMIKNMAAPKRMLISPHRQLYRTAQSLELLTGFPVSRLSLE
jgi:hypothetical protein